MMRYKDMWTGSGGWSIYPGQKQQTRIISIFTDCDRPRNSPIDCVFVLFEMASNSSSGRGRWNRGHHVGRHRSQRRRRGVAVARGKRSLDGSVRRWMWRQAPRGGIRYVMTGHPFVHSSSERTHRSTVMRRSTTVILKTETYRVDYSQTRLLSRSRGCAKYSKYTRSDYRLYIIWD